MGHDASDRWMPRRGDPFVDLFDDLII